MHQQRGVGRSLADTAHTFFPKNSARKCGHPRCFRDGQLEVARQISVDGRWDAERTGAASGGRWDAAWARVEERGGRQVHDSGRDAGRNLAVEPGGRPGRCGERSSDAGRCCRDGRTGRGAGWSRSESRRWGGFRRSWGCRHRRGKERGGRVRFRRRGWVLRRDVRLRRWRCSHLRQRARTGGWAGLPVRA